MPRAELPTSMVGWMVAVGAGVVGFLAGFLFISLCQKVTRGS
jgi:hypothetical protein